MTRRSLSPAWRSVLLTLAALPGIADAGIAGTVYVDPSGACDFPSIQAAINSVAPGSEIRLVGDTFTLDASLTATNRTLRIAGGFPACGAASPTGRTTLHANFNAAPVIRLDGSMPGLLNIQLADLVLADGHHAGGNGGGLAVLGTGVVSLRGVSLQGNHAAFGGGISAIAVGGLLTVDVLEGTQVGGDPDSGNTADYGGGVYCRDARLQLGHVDVMYNTATVQGGGLFAHGCEVLSTEAIGDLRIEHNEARDGGGVYAGNASHLTLRARPQQRISISHNAAILGNPPQRGGGVFLGDSGTRLDASGLRIDSNLARSFGAGLMIAGSEARLDRDTDGCLPGDDACSSLSGNAVRDAEGLPSGSAAAAFVAGGGSPLLLLIHTRMVGNLASGSVLTAGDAAAVALEGVLIAGNQTSGALLRVQGSSTLHADLVTLADNLGSTAFQANSDAPQALRVTRSILQLEAGTAPLTGSGTTQFDCLNTGPGGALGGSEDAPGFADPASGDYRLRPGSANLDRCAASAGELARDLAGYPRVVDRVDTPNAAGAVDRGAYEDPSQRFRDGFEE